MAPLRIATISYDWYPYEVRALRQTEAAADAGHEVDMICLHQPHKKKYEVLHGVHIYRLPLQRSFNSSLSVILLRWCWFLLLAAWKVTRLHLRRHYNVIHVHNMPDFLVFAALIPRLMGAKIILDVQDISPELMAAKVRHKKLLRSLLFRLASWQEYLSTSFAHHIVTTGPLFAQTLIRRGVPPQKITNILNSADPRLFPPHRRCPSPYDAASTHSSEQPFIVMYHGTLAERNGLDTAIQALALARQHVPQLRLDIQGNGDHLPFLKRLAHDLDIENHVLFTDSCTPDKLVDFVVHGDAGIIPYGYDGFAELVLPTKAYEFAWMQRPIIASDTPAMRSMFHPDSFILCDSSQPESFARAMIDLYQHPEKRARLIANATEDYSAYRWELMAKRYQQLLRSLCQK